MAFTELYCDPVSGSNLNAGSTNSAPVYSGVGDSDGTSVFTPSDGSTPANTVSVGMFASVYVTAGATVAGFVGRITNVAAGVNGAITLSTTAKCGTFPAASGGAHTISCVVGGYWKGPNAAVAFPFGFLTGALTDAAGDAPRVNLKNSATYSITAAMSHAGAGPIKWQGMTAAPGDGGQAVVDGGVAGASYVLLTVTGALNVFENITFQNNGASAAANGIALNAQVSARQVIVHDVRGSGISTSGNVLLEECEVYHAGQAGGGVAGVLVGGSSGHLLRCYVHDSAAASVDGVQAGTTGTVVLKDCVLDSNTRTGILVNGNGSTVFLLNVDFYNTTTSGVQMGSGTNKVFVYGENCNFLKNVTAWLNVAGTAGNQAGYFVNCALGTGTQTNGNSNNPLTPGEVEIIGQITYASGVTPWNSPTTGDFTVVLPAAEGTGRGNFTETLAGKSGTVGHTDVGAAANAQGAGGGGGTSRSRVVGGP